MSTIVDRALPDVRDGLKPSQRRLLVTMNDLNLGPRCRKHRTCAGIAGDTSEATSSPMREAIIYLATLGEHGPVVEDATHAGGPAGKLRLDRSRSARGHALHRGTRIGPVLAAEMLEDLGLETVDLKENYDGTRTEPTVLPGKFPNLLVNGGLGIRSGYGHAACSPTIWGRCANRISCHIRQSLDFTGGIDAGDSRA